MIWIGHVGIVIGLLPLSLGLWLLVKNKPILAGLIWSLIFLKPQFLPVVLLIVAALALNGFFKCAAGLAIGTIISFGFSIIYLVRI